MLEIIKKNLSGNCQPTLLFDGKLNKKSQNANHSEEKGLKLMIMNFKEKLHAKCFANILLFI